MTAVERDFVSEADVPAPAPLPLLAVRRPLDPTLPTAPSDATVERYLGRSGRWAQVVALLAQLLVVVSIAVFAHRSPWLWPMYLVVLMNVVGLVLTLGTAVRRGRVTAAGHRERWTLWAAERTLDSAYPSIDVFLPTCGESLAVLRNTYEHVRGLQWGGDLQVWVMDDGASAEVAETAAEFGFAYVVRPNRGEMKKAGNLKHAFDVTSGELILVLDADFCPRPDFLRHLVPYFDEPEVGIVQSPQYFATTPSMGWLERGAGSTQEMFYRWVQPARDRFGAAICVGTCAIYRRTALEAAGGFAQIAHSEDVHTGVAVMRAGGRLRYVPVVLSQGLCPDRLAAFVNQQYRWCTGSLTLLLRGIKRHYGLPLTQRLCFWSGLFYYVSTAVNTMVLPIPGLVMLTFFPSHVHPRDMVLFLPALATLVAVMPRTMTTRWRPDVVRVQLAYGLAHLVAITHLLTRRSAPWVATGADKELGAVAGPVGRFAVVVLGSYVVGAWTALTLDVLRYGIGRYWMLMVFTSLYTYLVVPLLVGLVQMLRGTTREPRRTPVRLEEPLAVSRLSWSETAARVILIAVLGMWAAGVVDVTPLLLR